MISAIERILKISGYQRESYQCALWFAQKLTGKSYVQLLIDRPPLSKEHKVLVGRWIEELVVNHKPLQYILGLVPFCDLNILVEPPVLIPRPETEEWVAVLIDDIKDKKLKNILDLCTGSGCIALALAQAFPESQVIGSDISEDAIVLAQKNKEKNKIENINFIQSDLFDNIPVQKFDIIVSNPPYISENEWQELEPSVREWEDKRALSADDEGLFLIKKIIKEACDFLKDTGKLVVEIDRLQGEAVCTFMKSCGYTDVNIKKDFSGLDRVVAGSYGSVK